MISCAKLARLGVVLTDPPATRGDYVSHVVSRYSDCCVADDWERYLRKPTKGTNSTTPFPVCFGTGFLPLEAYDPSGLNSGN